MTINLITYLRQLIKKIHYIIIVIIILTSLQFVYNKNRVDQSNLTLKINLYPIKVMYWTQPYTTEGSGTWLMANMNTQLINLIYEIEKSIEMNEEQKFLGTTCSIEESILTCKTQKIDNKDVANAKMYLKGTINYKLNNFFEKELFFIDKKLQSLESTIEIRKKNQKKLEASHITGMRNYVIEKNYSAQLAEETKVFDLYFLKESFHSVKDILLATDQHIEVQKATKYNSYPITIGFGFLIGMLIIFFGLTEAKPED